MILFTHIPRTSGKYVETKLIPRRMNRIYKFHKKLMHIGLHGSYKIPETTEVVTGHIPYGLHEYLDVDCDEFKYVTLLRDPISRWRSEFNHAMEYPRFVRPIWNRHSNALNFLEACIHEGRNDNIMTKQLSGLEKFTNVKQDYKNYMFMWAARKKRYDDADMKEMLTAAKHNLKYNYDFVGFMGKKFHKKLCQHFGWKFPKSPKTNASRPTSFIDWHNKDVGKLLGRLNRFDTELYEFALENIQ